MPGRGFRGGWGPRGRGWRGPRSCLAPFVRPRNPVAIAAAATGAIVATVLAPPPRRRRPPPPAGYVYVVRGGAPVRMVRVEEAPLMIMRTTLPTYSHDESGEELYHIEVTMNDRYKYTIARRYSQFDQLRLRIAPILRAVTAPFPLKHPLRRLSAAGIEGQRSMLQAWLQSIVTAASIGHVGLRLPIYDFLETALYYPPELPPEDAVASSAAASGYTAPATPAVLSASRDMPVTMATPVADTLPEAPAATPIYREADDDWAVPLWSREMSDTKLAMAGPDEDNRLSASAAAGALRSGTGAQTDDLRAVWELADLDNDGKLDRDEFALAWYLAQKAAGGEKPPMTLPRDLVPPSKRQRAPQSAANPFG